MLDTIIQIDIAVMRFINVTLANPVCDFTMPIVTSEWFVRGLLVVAVLSIAIWGGKYGRITALLAVLTVILSDQLSSHLIKPWVGRLRPCKELDWIHLLVNCSSGKSFPSSHATNSFAQAVLWSVRYPKIKWVAYPLAGLISVSRIFVGVHYPLDVLAGTCVGILAGLAILILYKYGLSRWEILKDSRPSKSA